MRRRSNLRLIPPKDGVTVRMYNTGFGDCFLLAFPAENDSARYVLIDCGVHHQFSGGSERMKLITEDIAKATGNNLQIVAVTHEHTDHITGFRYGDSAFKEIEIGELWLAWTEDPSNTLAKKLRDIHGQRIRALQAAVARLKETGSPLAYRLEGVLNFDLNSDTGMLKGNKGIFEFLRSCSQKNPERPEDYRTPGEPPLEIQGVKGVKCYVLGPPQDKVLIEKSSDKSETYSEFKALNEETAFMAAVMAASGSSGKTDEKADMEAEKAADGKVADEKASEEANKKADKNTNEEADKDVDEEANEEANEEEDDESYAELFRRSCPFDERLMMPKEAAISDSVFGEFFREHYGFGDDKDDSQRWRRIEEDWLSSASKLALNINSATNNTSLVLAFELTYTVPSKVLLFAADAQVGNWSYWQKLAWPKEGEKDGRVDSSADSKVDSKVTGKDLLKRTVLYKVGHHGSLNATLREKGLEMMDSRELVAMIPVDEVWARTKQNWDHPAAVLLKRLGEKSRGRVIRSDRIPEDGHMAKPDGVSDAEWNAFLENLDWDRSSQRLWIQYTVR